MVTFPNGKINLGLHITGRRADGFHDIETVFYPVPWKDVLETVTSDEVQIESFGLPIPGQPGENLVLEAYHLLAGDYDLPPLHFSLLKAIPIGAGLGGGSADAAFVLKLINDVASLKLTNAALEKYAAHLGSDCAFFIENVPALASGRGEVLTPIDLDLSKYFIVLIYPGLHINTGWAYGQIAPQQPPEPLKDVVLAPVEEWKYLLTNDFEQPVFHKHPKLKNLKETLYGQGAVYAAMSGSGSTIFGLFTNQPDKRQLAKTLNLELKQVFIGKLGR